MSHTFTVPSSAPLKPMGGPDFAIVQQLTMDVWPLNFFKRSPSIASHQPTDLSALAVNNLVESVGQNFTWRMALL
jgi:hypothetical protein